METGLPQIKDRLQAMAALAEDMVDRSVKALLEGDGASAHQVCIDDDQLDRMEEEIDELAMKILAGGPELSDLRAITISMKISNDLERIGDEASTIAKSVIQLNEQSNWKAPFREEIVAMGEKACLLLREAIQAYIENDSSRAKQLISQDDQMDSLNKFYQEELVGMMQNDPELIARYLDLGVIIKRLERVADHAINVAEDALIIGKTGDA
ncbi:MAG: phosphate signaling complex protein PhoU [Verrucomicrobiota bacterium]|nr:phosphate signaling complex protein PhoU [Verrucomicrobiota bacterium]